MKITDPGIIKDGEKDLIDAVKDDLDLDAVKEIIEKKMTAAALSSKGGEIVVHNNEIAFRLDFDVQLSGSLMFDRKGNYIPESGGEPDESSEAKRNQTKPLESETFESPGIPEPDEILETDGAFESDDILEQDENNDPEDLLSSELGLDNINESIEEAGPETLLSSDDDNGIDFDDDELNINLPDYDLDDDLDDDLDEKLTDDNLDLDTKEDSNIDDIAEDENTDIELDNLDQLADDLELDPATEEDGDIDDILKESREFWEQKKDS